MTKAQWRTVALDEVATIERSAIQPEDIAQGTAYLGLEHIESGGRILRAKPVDEGELASSKFKFTAQHVLYGKLRPYLAKISCPDFTGICSTDILPILPGPKLERHFLCHFLLQPTMVDYANSQATGANLPRLSPTTLAQFEIPLPPLAEQADRGGAGPGGGVAGQAPRRPRPTRRPHPIPLPRPLRRPRHQPETLAEDDAWRNHRVCRRFSTACRHIHLRIITRHYSAGSNPRLSDRCI
jgi:hypothetical protein